MAQFDHRPNKVDYMDVVNGTAEVWIRANIKEHDDPEGKYWTAEEVCFRTVQNREEVEAQADALFFAHSNIQTELTAAVQEFFGGKTWFDNQTSVLYTNLVVFGNGSFPCRSEARTIIRKKGCKPL